jgi:hypothetical protein
MDHTPGNDSPSVYHASADNGSRPAGWIYPSRPRLPVG